MCVLLVIHFVMLCDSRFVFIVLVCACVFCVCVRVSVVVVSVFVITHFVCNVLCEIVWFVFFLNNLLCGRALCVL